MKVALYARVSMDEKFGDNRFQDPENQLNDLRSYCAALKWDIHKEYVDKWSGADPNRPAFRSLLNDAMRRHFDLILIWKLDRFSREVMSVQVSYIQKLRERGIGIISLTESWLDTRKENPMSDLILAVMAWASAEERRKISERTRAGIRRLQAIGKWKGGRPKKAATSEQKKQIIEMASKGLGATEIMRKLNVSRITIKQILKGGPDLTRDNALDV